MKQYTKTITKFILISLTLFITAIFINPNDIKEFFTNTNETHIVDTDPLSNLNQARDITKGFCSNDMWREWSYVEKEMDKDTAGVASYDFKHGLNPSQTIWLHISPNIDQDYVPFVAWHECAHAKIRNIPTEQIAEITEQVDKEFECDYNAQECLADVMAVYMIGDDYYNYYHDSSTPEQLLIAEEVWFATPEIQNNSDYSYGLFWKISKLR